MRNTATTNITVNLAVSLRDAHKVDVWTKVIAVSSVVSMLLTAWLVAFATMGSQRPTVILNTTPSLPRFTSAVTTLPKVAIMPCWTRTETVALFALMHSCQTGLQHQDPRLDKGPPRVQDPLRRSATRLTTNHRLHRFSDALTCVAVDMDLLSIHAYTDDRTLPLVRSLASFGHTHALVGRLRRFRCVVVACWCVPGERLRVRSPRSGVDRRGRRRWLLTRLGVDDVALDARVLVVGAGP
jgi:hypothetical protein